MTPAANSRRATLTVAISIVVVAAAGSVGGLMLSRRFAEKAGGSVKVDGTSAGTFSFQVKECASGHAFVPGFFGADLRSGTGKALRVVDSGEEARLWLYPPPPGRGPLGIDKPSCSRWDVLVDWTHVTVNRVKTVSGHVRVDCAVGGGKLTADVDFERCAL